ncbi:M28 family metallopeptidase [Parasphingopyxis marina]|uniref:M28 family peptidase n=1 Tax=Parasphingopyxis marina TaxID=2761622 RepID=A0A842HXD1_9SPHN|nr:M28 family metallopeptidase [Parasphingopyxis marina]MBC2776600.1 M28 family peptidase [Parasphingopyxis marina]
MRFHRLATLLALPLLFAATAAAAQGDPDTPINAGQIEETVRTLASDTFEGRAPGTRGEDVTIGYLIGRFEALGLEPAGESGGWIQRVDLLHTQLGEPETLAITDHGEIVPWTFNEDIYLSTLQPADRVAIDNAEMVFVGYGVTAPERDWDDFGTADLTGKVAVFIVNDPDFEAGEGEDVAGLFGGQAMTYYGRWSYKFEEAARRGAVGALVIHDTPGAGYGWGTVTAPGAGAYDIVRAPENLSSLQLRGWISGDAAADLFARAGLDYRAERARARTREFTAIPLGGMTFSAAFPVEHETVGSRNVLARLPGSQRPEETVMLGAHWDAYGIGAPDETGDTIRRGANDDAIGIAALFEIARAFRAGPPPARSLVFAVWTAEERGLLGSEYYALNPLFPHETTVANLTVDVLQTAGLARDVILIGEGQNTLEDDLADAAAAQGRTVTPDSSPERGLFYRADHFSFAKRGVPTLLIMGLGGGADLVEGGREAGEAWVRDFTAHCYHQPCDRWSEAWNLDGAVQDIDLVFDIARDLANSERWPGWKAASEFREIREESAAARD